MFRKITIMIFLILTVVWFTNSDSIQPAREFIQNNIYVWSEMQEEKLPIYCVDTQKKQIALTFDTAWGNEDIPQILKILKQENVKATFFFCGDWISKYPADIKTIYEEGHDIASHGDHHKYMTKLTEAGRNSRSDTEDSRIVRYQNRSFPGTIWRLQRIRRKECKKNELLYDPMERRQPRLARANERTVN